MTSLHERIRHHLRAARPRGLTSAELARHLHRAPEEVRGIVSKMYAYGGLHREKTPAADPRGKRWVYRLPNESDNHADQN
jgi:hypothetical protein